MELARSAGALALLTAMKICNDRTASHRVQLQAADLLLRRGFGAAPSPAAGGVGRWPGLRENVGRCLDSFVRDEGTAAVAGAPPACDLQHARDPRHARDPQHGAAAPLSEVRLAALLDEVARRANAGRA